MMNEIMNFFTDYTMLIIQREFEYNLMNYEDFMCVKKGRMSKDFNFIYR